MESIAEVRAKLAEIARDNPDGLRGSEVKTMLRRALSSSFDESAYGFRSFASFLQEMGKVVKVVAAPATGGDLRVYPISTGGANATDNEEVRLALLAKLAKTGYDGDAPSRRRVLSRLFDAMAASDGPFTLSKVHDSMQQPDDKAPSFSNVVKYARTLSMGGALAVEESPGDVFFRDRNMSLAPDVRTAESLILAYEVAVATRLVAAAGETPIDSAMVCAVLGLDHEAPGDLTYCEKVLASAKHRAAAAAAQRAA